MESSPTQAHKDERRMSGILKNQQAHRNSSASHVGFDKIVVAEIEAQNSVQVNDNSGDVQMQDVNANAGADVQANQHEENKIEMSVQDAEQQKLQLDSVDEEEHKKHQEFLKKRKEFNKGEINPAALLKSRVLDEEEDDE
eukprot:403356955